jgi:hypothetical protein
MHSKSKSSLGEILLERGLLSATDLEEALDYQARYGGRLGWVLTSLGKVRRLDFFKTLAQHYDLPFRRLERQEIDLLSKRQLKGVPREAILEAQTWPVQAGDDCLLFTAQPESNMLRKFGDRYCPGKRNKVVVVTDMDFQALASQGFRQPLIDDAVYALFRRSPIESAYYVLSKGQIVFLGLAGLAALWKFYCDPAGLFAGIFLFLQVFYLICTVHRLVLSLVGARYEIKVPISREEYDLIDENDLPVYTVLVPVYKEPEVVGGLVDAVRKLDYPQNRLDVMVLLEEDDKATLEALKAATPPGNWRFIIVPDSHPRTKPKACNHGLFFARGEYLTIFDAEDIPEPDQLKKAVIAFRKRGPEFICFQAALNYFNAGQNVITRLFTLEYSYWFDYLLPGLDFLKLPIPLGGTSNHFHVPKLRELGAWDPFNVTEDADLGIRASVRGYKVGIINSTTYEEANSRYGNWLRQRSRWIKGYLQTILVINRRPFWLMRRLGLGNWLLTQLFMLNASVFMLINPIMWGFFAYWLMTRTLQLDPMFPPPVMIMGVVNLLIGNFLGIYLNMLAVFGRKNYKLLLFGLLNPFYWLFGHSVASYIALWQLVVKPHYWEKTQHGLAKRHTAQP